MIPFVNPPSVGGGGISQQQATQIVTAARRQPVVSIAALKALTPSAGDAVNVLGYAAAGDGGGGTFYYDGSSSATENGGTIIAPNSGGGRWIRVYSGPINVRWFGAKGDGVTNDTSAVQAADVAAAGGKLLFPKGSYSLPSGVTISNASVVDGSNLDAEFLGGIAVGKSGVTIKGILFKDVAEVGATNPTASVYATGKSSITIEGCRFDRTRIQIFSPDATPITKIICRGNLFYGDYTPYVAGLAPNVFWVYGADRVVFENNYVDVTSPYTFGKITTSSVAAAGRCVVCNNTIIINDYASGKQLFDFYNGMREMLITGNNIRILAGSCTTLFELKGNGTAGYTTAPLTNVVVSNNVAYGAFKRLTLLQGLYGSTQEVPHQQLVVSGNTIESTLVTVDAAIDVRGVTQALISANTIKYPNCDIAVKMSALLLSSVKSAAVIGNTASSGSITIAYLGGTDITYTKGVEAAAIIGNTMLAFNNYAGIFVNEQPGIGRLIITGNIFTVASGATGIVGNVYVRLGAVDKLVVTGNIGSHATGIYNSGTITSLAEVANSWNAPATPLASATAASLGSAAHSINTTNKYLGREVYDTTNGHFLRASGSGATAVWKNMNGGADITPA